MAESGSGARGSLLQLQESLSAGDRCSAAMASYQLIRGLGQECVLSSDPAVLGAYRPGRAEDSAHRACVRGGGLGSRGSCQSRRAWGFSAEFIPQCFEKV